MSLANLADQLVGEEMLTRRVKRPEARKIIADEAGISPGSLESLARGRLKNIERIEGRLNALLITKIEYRISVLKAKLEVARALGRAPQIDLERAKAALQAAEEAIGK